MTLPTTEDLLLHIQGFLKAGHKLESEPFAVVYLDDFSEWKLESFRYGNANQSILPHIALWNDMRAIAFDSVDEFRGWLRCYRSFIQIEKNK